jgi:glycosyltransferase involved in cell wall biosynthesis
MRDKIHIMHCYGAIRTNGFGGVERLLLITAKFNLKTKYDLSFTVFRIKEGFIEDIEKLGYPVYELKLTNAIYDLRVILKLIKLLRMYKPHIVHFYGKSNFFGRIAAKIAGIPIIICNEVDMVEFGILKYLSMLKRHLDFLPDKVIACSEAVRKYRDKKNSEKYVVIHSPFDLTDFPNGISLSTGNSFKNGEYPVIGTVARISPEKGHKYLIQAMPKILEAFPTARLKIIGTGGPFMREMKALAESLGLGESIEFTGYVEDLYSALFSLDVFVLASLTDAFPISVLEAMAVELPVAASAVDGIPEMITHGETGLLFPSKNSDALAETVIDLLSDIEKAKRMGKEARQNIVSKFTGQMYTQKLDALYQELLEAKGMR